MENSTNPFGPFGPEIANDVEGLIHVGNLTDEVEFCGHTIGIRTLTAYEEIAAAAAVEEFRNTLREPQAWATAQVGLAITHIDGDENFCPPIGPDPTGFAKARFMYISKNWYWPTIDFVYESYIALLDRQIKAIRAVQDLSNRSLLSHLPSLDSLIEPGISTEEIPSEDLP